MGVKQTEALKLALEAMRFALHVGFDESSESQIKKGDKAVRQHENAIAALRERLAQPEQEPVAWMWKDGTITSDPDRADGTWMPLYTTPPASKPLTMQERTSIVRANTSFHDKKEIDAYGIIDDVEAAHGITGEQK